MTIEDPELHAKAVDMVTNPRPFEEFESLEEAEQYIVDLLALQGLGYTMETAVETSFTEACMAVVCMSLVTRGVEIDTATEMIETVAAEGNILNASYEDGHLSITFRKEEQ